MKKKARVTSKGQVTVPHEIRRAMGIHPGDSLLFEQKGSEFSVRPLRTRSAFDKYQGIGNPGIPSGRRGIVRYLRRMRGQ